MMNLQEFSHKKHKKAKDEGSEGLVLCFLCSLWPSHSVDTTHPCKILARTNPSAKEPRKREQ